MISIRIMGYFQSMRGVYNGMGYMALDRLLKRMVFTVVACVTVGSVSAFSQTTAQDNGCPAEVNPPRPCKMRCPPIKLKLLRYVEPEYPGQARRAGIQGQVIIQAVITDKGEVEAPQLVSAHPLLGTAAMAAVRQWHYQPACLKGIPTAIPYTVIVNFRFKDGVPRVSVEHNGF
jgi:TonB family protein